MIEITNLIRGTTRFDLGRVTRQILEDIGASHFAFEVAATSLQGVSLGVVPR